MTNEEAKRILYVYRAALLVNDSHKEAFDMAIKALEQKDILDKIREEVKLLSNANPSYWHSGDMVEREEVFEIIDKYRESDDTEKLKPCINYEEDCEAWAGCPCVYYKAESED